MYADAPALRWEARHRRVGGTTIEVLLNFGSSMNLPRNPLQSGVLRALLRFLRGDHAEGRCT